MGPTYRVHMFATWQFSSSQASYDTIQQLFLIGNIYSLIDSIPIKVGLNVDINFSCLMNANALYFAKLQRKRKTGEA
jgi:hypothetical protein